MQRDEDGSAFRECTGPLEPARITELVMENQHGSAHAASLDDQAGTVNRNLLFTPSLCFVRHQRAASQFKMRPLRRTSSIRLTQPPRELQTDRYVRARATGKSPLNACCGAGIIWVSTDGFESSTGADGAGANRGARGSRSSSTGRDALGGTPSIYSRRIRGTCLRRRTAPHR